VKEDGKVILQKQLPELNIEAGATGILNLQSHFKKLKPNSEYYIEIFFETKAIPNFSNGKFEIARNQLLLKRAEPALSKLTSYKGLLKEQSGNKVKVSGKNFQVIIDSTGLSSYIFNGKELIKNTLHPNFKRILTDNDKRGWKPQRKLKQWYEYKLKHVETNVSVTESAINIEQAFSLINDSAEVSIIYHVYNDGVLKVNYSLEADSSLPNIPKVGMQMGIEKSFTSIEWYGRGPFENYIDKRTAADVGIYNLSLNQFMENYVVPQENGNRTDVRWMFLNNPLSKDGLLIVASDLLSMNASTCTDENIQNAKHTNKLKDAGFVKVDIDLIQMGVGGNDSWSDVAAPLEQYQIKAKNYRYSFYLVPFNAKNKSAIAKEIKF
jgi:beta-galactosidase